MFSFNPPLIQLPRANLSGPILSLPQAQQVVPPVICDRDPTPSSRLARNRQTARLRRERKKQEAEKLTLLRSQAIVEKNNLLSRIEALDVVSRQKFEEFKCSEQKGGVVSGCLFCEKQFVINVCTVADDVTESPLWRHYVNEHPHERKSNETHLGKDFLELVNKPEKLLEHVISLSEENMGRSTPSLDTESNGSQRKLSNEEKRKRRLERNAESARLCRQRKKLYIQRIRLELPSLQREIRVMNEFLGTPLKEESASVSDSKSVSSMTTMSSISTSSVPRMTGWDSSVSPRKLKRGLNSLEQCPSAKRFCDPKSPVGFNPISNYQTLMELNKTISSLMLASSLQSLGQQPNLMANSSMLLGVPSLVKDEDVFEAAYTLANLARR